MLRQDIDDLIRVLSSVSELKRIELTTNGLLVTPRRLAALKEAGLHRLKVSLDTLHPVRFREITGSNGLATVKRHLEAMSGMELPVRVNVVLCRSFADDVLAVCNWCLERGLDATVLDLVYDPSIRDFWNREFLDPREFVRRLSRRYGEPLPLVRQSVWYWRFPVGSHEIQVRDTVTQTHRLPPCSSCDQFCQSGIFGFWMSTDGWLGLCPVPGKNTLDVRPLLGNHVALVGQFECLGVQLRERQPCDSFPLLVVKRGLSFKGA